MPHTSNEWKVFFNPHPDSDESGTGLNLLGEVEAPSFEEAQEKAVETFQVEKPEQLIIVRK